MKSACKLLEIVPQYLDRWASFLGLIKCNFSQANIIGQDHYILYLVSI